LKKIKKKMNELLEGTNIEKAIHLVRVCKVTAYKACKLYGVKSGTLSAHLSGKVKSVVKGRPPRFTVEEEKALLDDIIQLAAWCFPQSISEVIEMARQFAIKLNKKATNDENDERIYIPGYHWLLG
jgi:hypothetical protein